MPGIHDEHGWEAAGLLDRAAPDADDRRALLAYLVEQGATLDEMRAAADAGQLRGLVAELQRRAERTHTASEIAELAGVEVDRVLQLTRVSGLPMPDLDDRVYRVQDVEAVGLFVSAIELFGEPATVEFTRSVGASLATVADSAMTLFGINVAARFDERRVPEVERARATTAAAESLTGEVPRVLELLFFHHVEAAVRRSIASAGPGESTARSAVAFVDLVRSTALVQELSADDLATAIGTFEQLAVEIVAARNGRVVKTIGDEVMFVVPSAAAACDAALALRDAVAVDGRLPAIRGAVAIGDLVRGYGDYYGPDVTMAARAVKVADPGTVVVTDAVRAEAGSELSITSVGAHRLRGFEQPVELFAVERA